MSRLAYRGVVATLPAVGGIRFGATRGERLSWRLCASRRHWRANGVAPIVLGALVEAVAAHAALA